MSTTSWHTTVLNDINTLKTQASSLFVNTPYVVAQSTTPALYSMATNNTLQGWVDFTFPTSMPTDWQWNVSSYYGDASGASLLTPFYKAGAACTNGGVGAPCFRPNAYHVVMLFQDAPMQNAVPQDRFPITSSSLSIFRGNSSADYTTENSWYWYQSPPRSEPNRPTSRRTAARASSSR